MGRDVQFVPTVFEETQYTLKDLWKALKDQLQPRLSKMAQKVSKKQGKNGGDAINDHNGEVLVST